MLFANKIKELREGKQLLQRAKREQIPMIAGILQTDAEQLLVLWLADQLIATVADDKSIADKALKIAQQALTNNI